MPTTDRTKLNNLLPNLDPNQVANSELMQDAITHLFDVIDQHMTEAAAHAAAKVTYTGAMGGGTVDGAFANTNSRINSLETSGLGPSPSVTSGTLTASTTAAALPSVPCTEVLVQSDPTNSGYVYVGSSGTQSFQLEPGDSFSFKLTNANTVYARGGAAGYVVNYLARG